MQRDLLLTINGLFVDRKSGFFLVTSFFRALELKTQSFPRIFVDFGVCNGLGKCFFFTLWFLIRFLFALLLLLLLPSVSGLLPLFRSDDC